MFLGAMVGCGLLGVAIERFAYRPLRNQPRIAPLISALGVAFFLGAELRRFLLFSSKFRNYDGFDYLITYKNVYPSVPSRSSHTSGSSTGTGCTCRRSGSSATSA